MAAQKFEEMAKLTLSSDALLVIGMAIGVLSFLAGFFVGFGFGWEILDLLS